MDYFGIIILYNNGNNGMIKYKLFVYAILLLNRFELVITIS